MPDCTTDAPLFDTQFDVIEYTISELNPVAQFYAGQVVQNNFICDVQFTLVEFGSGSDGTVSNFPEPPFKNYNAETGDFVIDSDDFLLDGVEYDMTTYVTSIYSQSFNRIKTDTFSVRMLSECREVTQWQPSQFDIDD